MALSTSNIDAARAPATLCGGDEWLVKSLLLIGQVTLIITAKHEEQTTYGEEMLSKSQVISPAGLQHQESFGWSLREFA